jgi:hypothetical protein
MGHLGHPDAFPYTTVQENDSCEDVSAVVTEALAVETGHVWEVCHIPHASHAH